MLGRAWRRQKHRIVAALREYDAHYGITEDDPEMRLAAEKHRRRVILSLGLSRLPFSLRHIRRSGDSGLSPVSDFLAARISLNFTFLP